MEIVSKKEQKQPYKMVFVGGAPRSGTTLVQRLLDGHPDIVGGPELNSLQEIVAAYENMRKRIDEGRIDFYFNKSELNRIFENFIRNLFKGVRDKYNAKIISEKTPSNVLVFQMLSEIINNASFIFVVRDPKDIVISLKKVRKKALNNRKIVPDHVKNLFLAIDHVYDHFKAGYVFCKKNKDKSLVVQYENLIKDPEYASKLLVDFLEIPFDQNMLELNGVGTSAIKARTTKVNSLFYNNEDATKPIVSSSIDRWKKELSTIIAGFVDLSFEEFTNKVDTKSYSSIILFKIYRIHRFLIKANNIFGKFYKKIIFNIYF